MMPHGTNSRYTNHRCRCDECRQAHRDYAASRRRYAAAHPLPPDDPRHGTVVAYVHYLCRCERCKRAASNYRSINRIRNRYA